MLYAGVQLALVVVDVRNAQTRIDAHQVRPPQQQQQQRVQALV
jgi:hypothetical protein